jgi:hypothetical protein
MVASSSGVLEIGPDRSFAAMSVVLASSASCSYVPMAYPLIDLAQRSEALSNLRTNGGFLTDATGDDEVFRMSWEKAFQEYLRMSQLTQREFGRGDNNEAGKSP